MLLTDEKYQIRVVRMEDAELLCRWWNDSKIMAHAGFPNGLKTTVQEVRKQIENNSSLFIIEVDAQPVGEMNYHDKGNGGACIGIKICEFEHQNKGAGTQFLKMLVSYLFNELKYETISLDTNLNNIRAQRVYEKIGFRKLKINENCWQNQLGEWQTTVDYELTLADFKA